MTKDQGTVRPACTKRLECRRRSCLRACFLPGARAGCLPMTADPYEISADPARLDLGAVHAYLSGESYWARGIPRALVERSAANSLCFGVYAPAAGEQVGFARVVTDRATFAYLADVYLLPAHRGRGLSKRLMAAVLAHRDLQGLRRFLLATKDAHGLYEQFGFAGLERPDWMMERRGSAGYGADPAEGLGASR